MSLHKGVDSEALGDLTSGSVFDSHPVVRGCVPRPLIFGFILHVSHCNERLKQLYYKGFFRLIIHDMPLASVISRDSVEIYVQYL